MKIHEYQAKAILARHGVPVPRGEVAFSAQDVSDIARRLGTGVVVVKAQIHAGGRGKAGGVKVVKSADDAEAVAKDLLGRTLVTYQTGPDGQKVSRLLVEEGLAIDRELYLGLVVDRSTQRIVLMVSKEGGVEIEEVAAKTPEKIHKVFINPAVGLQPFQAQQMAFAVGSDGRLGEEGRQDDARALPGVRGDRRVDPRDQPADRHQDAATCWRSTPRSTSTTTRCFVTPTFATCAT